MAREWFEVRRGGWVKGYSHKVIARLESDIFPYVGSVPLESITPTQLLEVLRRIKARGVIETTHRALESYGNGSRRDQSGARPEGRAAQA